MLFKRWPCCFVQEMSCKGYDALFKRCYVVLFKRYPIELKWLRKCIFWQEKITRNVCAEVIIRFSLVLRKTKIGSLSFVGSSDSAIKNHHLRVLSVSLAIVCVILGVVISLRYSQLRAASFYIPYKSAVLLSFTKNQYPSHQACSPCIKWNLVSE